MKKQTIIDKLKFNPNVSGSAHKALEIFYYFLAAIGIFIFSYLLHINFVVPAFLLCLVFYMKFMRRELKSSYNLLQISLLYIIIFAPSYFIITRGLSFSLIPFAVVPMLAALLFNDRILTLIITLAGAVTISRLSVDPYCIVVGLLFLISGMVSGILVFGARRRNTIINTGIVVGIVQAASGG